MTRSVLNFLNENLGLITLIAAFIAYFIYLKQKQDNKKDAAKLILQEVRYAEQQIRNARDVGYAYPLANKLLLTNSWHKNINLFVKDLKESEIDLISKFYANAAYLDIVIGKISDEETKRNILERTTLQPSLPNIESIPSSPSPGQISPLPINIDKVIPNSQIILREVSQKIEFIYNTPAIDKLREISEKKWHQFFN